MNMLYTATDINNLYLVPDLTLPLTTHIYVQIHHDNIILASIILITDVAP